MTAEALNSSGLKPNSKTIARDLLAGLIAAIAAIPDGMASAVLAGVNPVFGLYNLLYCLIGASRCWFLMAVSSMPALLILKRKHQALMMCRARWWCWELGSTALRVFQGYAQALQQGNGRLLLADVNDALCEQLERRGLMAAFSPENILLQNPLLVATSQEKTVDL